MRRKMSTSVRVVVVFPVPPFCERTVIVVGHPARRYRAEGLRFRFLFHACLLGSTRDPEEWQMSHPVYPPGGRGIAPSSASGLHDQQYEHDACGVGFVARLHAPASHEVVAARAGALERLEHRGAEGADPDTGDGAGILIQLPDAFLRAEVDFELPAPGRYGVGMCFLPQRATAARRARARDRADRRGARASGCWAGATCRSTPSACGRTRAPPSAPHIRAALRRRRATARPTRTRSSASSTSSAARIEQRARARPRDPELLVAHVVYKGMLSRPSSRATSPTCATSASPAALALVHSRFSTNTFPSWELAHPYRMIAHNGEINTLRGNRNWMRAREAAARLAAVRRRPATSSARSLRDRTCRDSASLDDVLELLVLGGRSLPHAMIDADPRGLGGPRASCPQRVRDFYAYHASLIEPWDGPAAVAFTDGRVIGATLDRNGLRPGRWLRHPRRLGGAGLRDRRAARAGGGRRRARAGCSRASSSWSTSSADRIVDDAEVKRELAARQPYGDWLAERVVRHRRPAREEPARAARRAAAGAPARLRLDQEDLRVLLAADGARRRQEPTGSMGNDIAAGGAVRQAAAALSYFKQLFAQVTNPPIDPIRESIVMSLAGLRRPRGQPARRDARALPPARDAAAAPAQRRAREAAPGRPRACSRRGTIDITWPVQRAARRHGARARPRLPPGVGRGRGRREHPDPVRPQHRPPSAPRSRAARDRRRVHHHLVREGTRLRSASSSRRARRARSTTSPA